jgi:hypothetical protein
MKPIRHYILKGKTPVPEPDFMKWAMTYGLNNAVELTEIGNVSVSTVFLGIDHNYCAEGPPILFETMVFNGKYDQYQIRYTTWNKAKKGHKETCDMVLQSFAIEEEGLKKMIIEGLN